LGAAANAMAAILDAEKCELGPIRRGLKLVSFENDLDSLRLALDHPRWFKHLRHPAPATLLTRHSWENPAAAIEWQLLVGDFAEQKLVAQPPDIIFFDPFSFKTDGALWTQSAFSGLLCVCCNSATELYTYSYSTSVRAAMLAAGFHVAKGRGTGPKAETTIGLSPRAALTAHGHELLGKEWLEKWQRSDAQAPFGSAAEDDSWREAIRNHPQFVSGCEV